MLIVSPNSTCGIYMENYMDGEAGMPDAITYGHIFCRGCPDRIQPQCPICRRKFDKQLQWSRRTNRIARHASNTMIQLRTVVRCLSGVAATLYKNKLPVGCVLLLTCLVTRKVTIFPSRSLALSSFENWESMLRERLEAVFAP
ncbi:hypothetical protein OG21DRAFT_1111695 [Imleria badia]|nr:hypothetical protein OG21DRAFT_1111695 [Imleria badia]